MHNYAFDRCMLAPEAETFPDDATIEAVAVPPGWICTQRWDGRVVEERIGIEDVVGDLAVGVAGLLASGDWTEYGPEDLALLAALAFFALGVAVAVVLAVVLLFRRSWVLGSSRRRAGVAWALLAFCVAGLAANVALVTTG